jgi:hypothetical protein
MSQPRPTSSIIRAAARALLGAVLFLVFASYLALPCMTRDASQFQSVGSPNSCSQRDVFKPAADLSRLFTSMTAEARFRLPILAIAFVAASALIDLEARAVQERFRRRRRSRPSRLPFSSADPPKLPHFAALRDA